MHNILSRTSQPFDKEPCSLEQVVDEADEAWTREKPLEGNHTELYGLSAFAYETAYLGFLWVAHFNAHTDGTIEVELVSSVDGEDL